MDPSDPRPLNLRAGPKHRFAHHPETRCVPHNTRIASRDKAPEALQHVWSAQVDIRRGRASISLQRQITRPFCQA